MELPEEKYFVIRRSRGLAPTRNPGNNFGVGLALLPPNTTSSVTGQLPPPGTMQITRLQQQAVLRAGSRATRESPPTCEDLEMGHALRLPDGQLPSSSPARINPTMADLAPRAREWRHTTTTAGSVARTRGMEPPGANQRRMLHTREYETPGQRPHPRQGEHLTLRVEYDGLNLRTQTKKHLGSARESPMLEA